jgi:hypothetical protein
MIFLLAFRNSFWYKNESTPGNDAEPVHFGAIEVISCSSGSDILKMRLWKAASCELAGLQPIFHWRNRP